MNYIVADIGNTLTKIALINKNFKILKVRSCRTIHLLSKKKVIQNFTFNKLKTNKKIFISSVVPSVFKSIKKNLAPKNIAIEIKSLKLNSLVKIKVKNPKKLGSDRIANAIGCLNYYKSNCIVVDFGTATTFDIIKREKSYIGGIITPGIETSIKNLSEATAALPKFNLKPMKLPYGKNTIEALNTGFIWGYQGLINNIILKIQRQTKTKFKLIFTGGHSSFFKKYIKSQIIIDRFITIKGLIQILKNYEKK